MNDDESIKLVELAFAWVELREHLSGILMSRVPNVARGMVDVEIRMMELIAVSERDAKGLTLTAIKNLRQLQAR